MSLSSPRSSNNKKSTEEWLVTVDYGPAESTDGMARQTLRIRPKRLEW